MSLLLDALKRAEEAKRAKESAEGGVPYTPASAPVQMEELDIAEDYPPARQTPRTDALTIEPEFHPTAERNQRVPVTGRKPEPAAEPPYAADFSIAEPVVPVYADRETEHREAARNVFAAKQPSLSNRGGKWLLPLIAVLIVGVGGGVWYIWQEVVAKRYLPTARPIPPPPSTVVASQPADKAAGKDAKAPALALPPLLPPPAKEVPLPAVAAKSVATVQLTEREALAKDIKESVVPAGSPVQLRLSKSFELPKVNPDLLAGYQALSRGDYGRARSLYTQAAQAEPFNIDAHLGLAAAGARSGDNALAARHYRRVLEIDPRNSMAISGLLAVAGQVAPEALEVELKTMISRIPDAPTLHFSLGNLYAGDRRWTEAQQAYFDAFRLDPDNADYIYNLAVSLDHLNQVPLALEYYQRALAAKSAGQYDRAAVARRIGELKGG